MEMYIFKKCFLVFVAYFFLNFYNLRVSLFSWNFLGYWSYNRQIWVWVLRRCNRDKLFMKCEFVLNMRIVTLESGVLW